MSILITNDDGISAPGIRSLEKVARQFFPEEEIITVAPDGPYSQCGHRVTTETPLTVTELEKNRFAVNGTPADCVRIALFGKKITPRWVLSGINAGGNLGQDLYISGTAAAAREASYHGIQAVAFSQYRRTKAEPSQDESQERATLALEEILRRDLPVAPANPCFWNVNLPHPEPGDRSPQVIDSKPGRHPLPVGFEPSGENEFIYAGTYQNRLRESESDVDICFSGDISLSLVEVLG